MKKTKTIFIIFAILISSTSVGYVYFGSPDEGLGASPLSSSNADASDPKKQDKNSSGVSNKFLQLLLSINSINLSTELFAKPNYLALRDFSTVLETNGQTEGRPNPFAAFSNDSDLSGTNTNNQTNQVIFTVNPIKNITTNSALVSATIPRDIVSTERYFEYTNTFPNIFDKKTANLPDNSVVKVFGTIISGLSPNTTYYYRAVIKAGNQVFYSQVSSFKTLATN